MHLILVQSILVRALRLLILQLGEHQHSNARGHHLPSVLPIAL